MKITGIDMTTSQMFAIITDITVLANLSSALEAASRRGLITVTLDPDTEVNFGKIIELTEKGKAVVG